MRLSDLKEGDIFIFAPGEMVGTWDLKLCKVLSTQYSLDFIECVAFIDGEWSSEIRGGMYPNRQVLQDGPDFDYLLGYYDGYLDLRWFPEQQQCRFERWAKGHEDGHGDRIFHEFMI